MCKGKHGFLQVVQRRFYILSQSHFCKNILNVCFHTSKRTSKRTVSFPCKVSCILFRPFKEHLHCKLCFFCIACYLPFKIKPLFKCISLQSCCIHGNAQVVHHGKIALCSPCNGFHGHAYINAHNRGNVRSTLHCFC